MCVSCKTRYLHRGEGHRVQHGDVVNNSIVKPVAIRAVSLNILIFHFAKFSKVGMYTSNKFALGCSNISTLVLDVLHAKGRIQDPSNSILVAIAAHQQNHVHFYSFPHRLNNGALYELFLLFLFFFSKTWASVTSEAFRPSLSPATRPKHLTKTAAAAATAKLSQKLPIPHVELQQVAVLDPLSVSLLSVASHRNRQEIDADMGRIYLSLFRCVCIYMWWWWHG